MASKAYLKNIASFEIIPSDVVPTTGYTDAAPVVVDRTTDGGSENAIGCASGQIFANITAGPAADTALNVYAEWSYDGTNYSAKEYVGTISVTSAQTGYTEPTGVFLVAPYAKFYLQAPDAVLTCVTYVSPEYWEGQ